MTILAWQRAEPSAGAAAPTIVLLHGWGGDGPGTWRQVAERLVAAGVAVLVPDLPGHGASADVRVPAKQEPAGWTAGVLLADLDRLHVGQVAAAGHELGGVVAGHLALDAPARVQRLVLVSCDDRPWLAAKEEVAAGLRDPAASVWHPEAVEVLARARRDRRHRGEMLADWAARAAWPAAARLGALRTPVLLAVGAEGRRRERAPRLARLFHDARLVTVAGDDQTLFAAPELAAVVADFVKPVARSAAPPSPRPGAGA